MNSKPMNHVSGLFGVIGFGSIIAAGYMIHVALGTLLIGIFCCMASYVLRLD